MDLKKKYIIKQKVYNLCLNVIDLSICFLFYFIYICLLLFEFFCVVWDVLLLLSFVIHLMIKN